MLIKQNIFFLDARSEGAPTPTHQYVELKIKEESVRTKEQKQNSGPSCKTVQEKQGHYKEKLCKGLLRVKGVGLAASLKTQLKTTFFYTATPSATGVWTGLLKTGSCFDPSGSLLTFSLLNMISGVLCLVVILCLVVMKSDRYSPE